MKKGSIIHDGTLSINVSIPFCWFAPVFCLTRLQWCYREFGSIYRSLLDLRLLSFAGLDLLSRFAQ